jgi:hypothetical protein
MTRIVVGRGNWKAQRCIEALVKYEMMKRSNSMTSDEELAEQYALENYEYYGEGQTDYKALKQAFLAALKAGKEKYEVRIKGLTQNRDELLAEIERLEERVGELEECY